MTPESIHGPISSFQVATPITIGRIALNSLPGLLVDLAVENPFWILPDEIVQQRSIKKILSHVYGKRHIDWESNSSIITSSTNVSDLTEMGQYIRKQGHDGILLAGDSDTLGKGKIAAQELKTIVVPCGESDCSEFSVQFPSHTIGDGRLTRATTPKNVARTVCSALMHICTSLLENENPMLMGIAESGLQHAHQTMELLLEPGLTGQRWIDCTLFAISTSHAAGICAQNRGESTIINFCKHLAISGLADQYQTTAAMLPAVFSLIDKQHRPLYTHMKRLLRGMDPIEFSKAWLSLTEPKGTDQVLQQLCGELKSLFIDKDHEEELVTFLAHFPIERRS
jgi:alcohol dehydrogenase class IV